MSVVLLLHLKHGPAQLQRETIANCFDTLSEQIGLRFVVLEVIHKVAKLLRLLTLLLELLYDDPESKIFVGLAGLLDGDTVRNTVNDDIVGL